MARSGGSGGCRRSGASRDACSAGSKAAVKRNVPSRVGEALLGWTHPAPPKRSLPHSAIGWSGVFVCKKLRGAPLAPGMRCLCQLRMELLDEPRLAEARRSSPTTSTRLAFAPRERAPSGALAVPVPPLRGRQTALASLRHSLRPPPLARTMRRERAGQAETRP